MWRSKDFLMVDVIDLNGKRMGFVKDILLNFNGMKTIGFMLSSFKFFSKNLCVLVEDIISLDKLMVVRKAVAASNLKFSDLRNMDVIDVEGNLIGIMEDILVDRNFDIKGIIITSGIIKKLFKGKRILLMNELILGENNILFYGRSDKLNFVRVPHKIIGVEKYEKSI